MHIDNLWQYYVCRIRSGVTLFTLCMEALPVTNVPVRVTRSALVAHRYTYAPSRCKTSQCYKTFIHISVSLRNDLADPVFEGEGLADSKSRASAFVNGASCSLSFVFHHFLFLFFLSVGWCCGAGVFGQIRCKSLSPGLAGGDLFCISNKCWNSFVKHSSHFLIGRI